MVVIRRSFFPIGYLVDYCSILRMHVGDLMGTLFYEMNKSGI